MPLQDGRIAVAIAESAVAKASAQTKARVMENFMVLWVLFYRVFPVIKVSTANLNIKRSYVV